MCCEPKHHHSRHHHAHTPIFGGCCCPPRRFLTKEEQIEKLERYKKELEKELAALGEHLEELKK